MSLVQSRGFRGQIDWSPGTPAVYCLPNDVSLPWLEEIRERLGEVGYLGPWGDCGYEGALVGLILYEREEPQNVASFRLLLSSYAMDNIDVVFSCLSYREILEAYVGSSDVLGLRAYYTNMVIPSIFDQAYPSYGGVPEKYWFDYSLIAPLISLKYDIAVVLYSFGGNIGSEMTLVCRPVHGRERLDVIYDTYSGLLWHMSTDSDCIVLVLYEQHYYIVRTSRNMDCVDDTQFITDDSGAPGLPVISNGPLYPHFEDDPHQACLLWYQNSDLENWDCLQSLRGATILQRYLEKEVLTDLEMEVLLSTFYRCRGYNGPEVSATSFVSCGPLLLSCGVCGMREFDVNADRYVKMKIDELDCLMVTDPVEKDGLMAELSSPPLYLPINDPGRLQAVWPVMAKNFFRRGSTGEFYMLFPELIEDAACTSPWTWVCIACAQYIRCNEKPPPYSLKYVDFGNPHRLGLLPLTAMERAIIARVRHYQAVVKVRVDLGGLASADSGAVRSQLKSHCILFPHDAPDVAPSGLLLGARRMSKPLIRLQFMGPQGAIDHLSMETFRTCSPGVYGRWHVVYSWLAVLSRVNGNYSSYALPGVEQVRSFVESCNQALEASAVFVPLDRDPDKNACDDVADVRDSTGCMFESRDDAVDGEMTYSLVCGDNTGVDEKKTVVNTLRCAAESFGVRCAPDLSSVRDTEPVSEFENNEFGLVGAFPDVFLLGRAYGRNCGMLSPDERRHMLLHFSCGAAVCRELICYLFDQLQRHTTIRAVKGTVRGNCKAFARFFLLSASSKVLSIKC